MEDKSRDYIRFDWAIKRLLRNKANFGVLEGFIKVFVGEDCKIQEILESESNQENDNDKFNRVDIKAKNTKGEIFIVEVQLSRYIHYIERVLYGVSKAVTEQVNKGEGYGLINRVYSISILYFDFGEGDDYIYCGTTEFIGMHTKDKLKVSAAEYELIEDPETKKRKMRMKRCKTNEKKFVEASLKMPMYYILRVNNFDKYAVSTIDEWMAYLKTGQIKDSTDAPGLVEAKEIMKIDQMSDEERNAYYHHLDNLDNEREALDSTYDEGYTEGEAKGIEKGIEKGIAQGIDMRNREIARNMKSLGMLPDVIAAATGLSREEIETL